MGTVILTVQFDPDDGSAASDGVSATAVLKVCITSIRPSNGSTGNCPDIGLATITPIKAARFEGITTRPGHDGKGRWGRIWADDARSCLHGTFGWAAHDGSATLLGIWTAVAESNL